MAKRKTSSKKKAPRKKAKKKTARAAQLLAQLDDNTIDVGVGEGFDPQDMPQLRKIETKKVNEALSDKLLVFNVYGKQRNLSERRFRELVRKMNDGRFHGGDIALAELQFDYVGADGKTVRKLLMNSQHCLAAIKHTKKAQTMVFKYFRIKSPKQLPILYAQFDPPGGQRTPTQIAQSYTEHFPDWTAGQINSLASGICLAKIGKFLREPLRFLSPDEKINVLFDKQVKPIAEKMHRLLYRSGNYKHLLRQPVIGVIYATFANSPRAAAGFWEKVQIGAGLEPDCAEYLLREFLMSVVLGNTAGRGKEKMSNEDVARRCIQAWNYAAEGKRTCRWNHMPQGFPTIRTWNYRQS